MSPVFPRYAAQNLREALEDSPATLIHGPRQCGKTTLALDVGKSMEYGYLSFDDEVVRSGAKADPIGFVHDLPTRIILDEVQHVPELFSAIKLEIDRNRNPGQFILTGSTNILLLPTLSDSLAGRMDVLRLHPLAQCEIQGQQSGFLNRLFSNEFETQSVERLGDTLIQSIVAGGYPAALHRTSTNRRTAWYRDYLDTLVQRDVRDLARIGSLDIMPRLLTGIAGQTARLMNVSDLASPFQISRPTIREYVSLLTRVFLLDELPPWHNNRLSRLVKTPKLHMGDTGTCCSLLGVSATDLKADRTLLGQLLETFVFQDVKRQASWYEQPLRLSHYRDRDGVEVDIVIEKGINTVAGIEIKAAASVSIKDFRGLKKLSAALGKRFVAGVVIYDGETLTRFGDGLYAVPISALWKPS